MNWILRPFTSLLPAVVDPPRIAVVAGALVILVLALAWPSRPFTGTSAFTLPADAITGITAVAALALAARGIASASARWKVLLSADPGAEDLRRLRSAASRRAAILLVATAVALVPLAVTARMGLWVAASIWIVVALACGVVTGRVARGVATGAAVRRAARWAPAVAVGAVVLAAVAVGIAGLAGAAVHVPAAGSGAWAAWWVGGAGLVVAAALLWGWQKPWFALVSALAAVALGSAGAALTAWLGAPAYGVVAWTVAIVVWGNVVWLSPETGWGSRLLDDRPGEPR